MSVSWNGPLVITPASGSAHSINYELDTSQNDAYSGHTSRTYEHPASQQNPTAGITFYYNATTTKQYINVNIVGNTGSPDYVVNTTTNTGGSGISEVEYTAGDVIQTWSASYSGAPLCIFTTTSAMNFVVGSGGGGSGGLSNSYEGTLTVNGSNLNWAIPNAATTGNYELMSKVLPAGNFIQELPIAHTAYNGGTSGYVVNFDSSKQWILRAPDGVTLDTAGASPLPNEKRVFCNFW